MIWAVHVARMRERRANRSLGRDPGAEGGDNTKMNLQEIRLRARMGWIDMPQDVSRLRAVVNTVMNFQIP